MPTFPTTIPAARLASRAASASSTPTDRAEVRVATTVSPAPDTSKTSRASAGRWVAPSRVTTDMPCSLRVATTASMPQVSSR